ncbi:ABC transporter ATP-binding protein [Actinophytocola xanthii]|uniref:ABC transporter n=1 Tax=Actinophytocola xanthii TaxID=1912961 RepID=A0A1Q8CXN2_9PSEU|nr:ABC transporter ATP-binding protein [Actinophytocola xanthii]OLF19119.1 ABC transporter [Actinophytocola xanthii]
MSAEPAVRIVDLRKIHGTGTVAVTALDGITLDFPAGTFTAIMGPSGSGKSTLAQCAAGLDRPTSGEVAVDGVLLNAMDETELTVFRRKRIGFVFQAFNLLPSLTAEENVTLPLRLAGARPTPGRARVALATVGLGDRAGSRPSELSGGQQQRVAIARALVTAPAIVFADEPTGALDSGSGRDVLRLLRSLVDEHRHTVIMVTHDPVAAAQADRVVVLSDGRVAEERTAEKRTAEKAR